MVFTATVSEGFQFLFILVDQTSHVTHLYGLESYNSMWIIILYLYVE